MVRNYIRKSNRGSWTLENLQLAIAAVNSGISKCSAAREYGVPKKTLLRYLAKSSHPTCVSRLGSFSSVFTSEQEKQLMEHILYMSECYFGYTSKDVRSLAFELAESNGIPHPFETSKRLAGYDWFKCFLKRHPTLTLRSPENTSLARATGFNRCSVNKFFDLLERIFDDHPYPAHRIWNMDETGFSTVPTKPSKVVAKKGLRQVAGISSSERGVNTTVVIAMSASGEFLPPMFIFARQRMNDALKIGAPEGSVFSCNPSGWSTITTCVEWFDHFLSYTQPSAESPVLLILDGHSSHTRNLQMLEKAKRNFVRIVSIPPHTSHKVQPLDVTMMGPLKSHYGTALAKYQNQHPGKAITPYNICALVNKAFVESASVKVAQSGFRATGIHPFNRSVFTDNDFKAANFLHSNDNETSALPEEPNILPETSDNDPVNGNFAIDKNDCSVVTVEQIDADEYYMIRNNGDIIIGPILNLEYEFAEQQPELANNSDGLNGECSLEAACPERSVSTGGYKDDSAHDASVGLSDASQENEENLPLLQQENVMAKGKKKKKLKSIINNRSSSGPEHDRLKKVRWDHNLKTSANDETHRLNTFKISPSLTTKQLKVSHPMVTHRKKTSAKKEQALELTASPHRKKLVEASALKDISNIKKTVRKRTSRKAKPLPTNDADDILCSTCGETFSLSGNGNGWFKCIFCQEWFHVHCAKSAEKCNACE